MNPFFRNVFFVYIVGISLLPSALTCIDKMRAGKPGKRRIPENTLLRMAALGGAAAMFFTMLLIRHKTRHGKFMIGLQILMVLQAAVLLFLTFGQCLFVG